MDQRKSAAWKYCTQVGGCRDLGTGKLGDGERLRDLVTETLDAPSWMETRFGVQISEEII